MRSNLYALLVRHACCIYVRAYRNLKSSGESVAFAPVLLLCLDLTLTRTTTRSPWNEKRKAAHPELRPEIWRKILEHLRLDIGRKSCLLAA